MKKFFSFLKRPPAGFAVFAVLAAAACIAGAIACAACGCAGWYVYALYAAAALSLAYIVYLSVRGGSALRAKAAARARAHPLAESFFSDAGFRSAALFSLSFIVNIAYALLCGVLGIVLRASWYGMFSFYYLLLSALRCGLLAGAMRSRRRAAGDARGLLVSRWKLYRLCGIALFGLEFALAAAVTVMVAVGRPAPVSEVLAIASAAYTFYKVISAAVAFVKVRRLHDPLRQGSFDRVMRGIALLKKHGVEWNAMATVNSLNAPHPAEFYRFFKSIGCRYLQFTPVVERTSHAPGRLMAGGERGGRLTPESVTPEAWGAFACGVFDEWVRADVGRVYVQLFDDTLAGWAGVPPGVCSLAPVCGQAPALEANGDLYSCDHFVFPPYRLGNILAESLAAMMNGARQQAFGLAKQAGLTRQCRECRWLFACNGECPRNRFATDCHGSPGHNYLCEGYRRYFAHVAPCMDFMRAELAAGRAPAGVMDWLRGQGG